jgi:hypothetical protein
MSSLADASGSGRRPPSPLSNLVGNMERIQQNYYRSVNVTQRKASHPRYIADLSLFNFLGGKLAISPPFSLRAAV